jgi:hypothetical protein
MKALSALSAEVRQYLLVTGNYWAFTLTDGALRMLVVLHFHALGYSALQIAAVPVLRVLRRDHQPGGRLPRRAPGLNRTMNIGLAMQVLALLMLTVPAAWLTCLGDGRSGAVGDRQGPEQDERQKLDQAAGAGCRAGHALPWVAILTGSKNALKGVGFFLGGACWRCSASKALLAMAGSWR